MTILNSTILRARWPALFVVTDLWPLVALVRGPTWAFGAWRLLAAMLALTLGAYGEAWSPWLVVLMLAAALVLQSHRHGQARRSLRAWCRREQALAARLQADRLQLERALEAARQARQAQLHFMATASHDLRQPLHAMTMFLSTLSFHVAGPEPRRLLMRLMESARAMEQQFNALLDLSRLDAQALVSQPESVDLSRLLARVVDEHLPQAQAKGLQIHVDLVGPAGAPLPKVHTDPLLLTRLVTNLLSNAVKYTDAGAIQVRVRRGHASCQIEIEDTGRGIPSHQHQRIFDEYVRLQTPGQQPIDGVGLGLSIVRRMSDLLDARLTMRSAPGQGTCFSFELPWAAAQRLAA